MTTSPDIMGGTPVFAGTRVPIQTLIEYLEARDTIDEFLEGFPMVRREQVQFVMQVAADRSLVDYLRTLLGDPQAVWTK